MQLLLDWEWCGGLRNRGYCNAAPHDTRSAIRISTPQLVLPVGSDSDVASGITDSCTARRFIPVPHLANPLRHVDLAFSWLREPGVKKHVTGYGTRGGVLY
jgi:hypothetical protein